MERISFSIYDSNRNERNQSIIIAYYASTCHASRDHCLPFDLATDGNVSFTQRWYHFSPFFWGKIAEIKMRNYSTYFVTMYVFRLFFQRLF